MGVLDHKYVLASTYNSEIVDEVKLWIRKLHSKEQTLFTVIRGLENNIQTIFFSIF